MLRTARRLLVGALVIAVVAATASVLPSDDAPPASAQAEDFYTPPDPLPSGSNGDIIKSEAITYSGATATRIMYLSRDVNDQPMPVTGTVLVPDAEWSGPGERPIVAYAPFTAGMGDQCAVSKLVAGETGADLVSGNQTTYMNELLAKGFAIAQTDYQGLGPDGIEHSYVMRIPQAHATLDVIRAAQRLPDSGLAPNGPVGVAGYSQGGGASAAAAEFEPTYAPELDLQGAYVGAAPADLGVLADTLDGGFYAAFLGYTLISLAITYPETGIPEKANEEGLRLFEEARQTCTLDAVFAYQGKQTSTLTKDGRAVREYLPEPPFPEVIAENSLGSVAPETPVLVEHSTNDDVLPYEQAKTMFSDWCAKGATAAWNDLPPGAFLTHISAMPQSATNAANWLEQRFNGEPPTDTCGQA